MMSKAEKTRAFIIERTASIFNAKGYAGTSINDLMNVTGLTKGSIYGNFENKDEVALAAFDYNFALVIAYIKKEMSKQENTINRLLVYPKIYRNFFKLSFLSAGCPIANTSTEADDTHPLLKEKAASALDYWRLSLERQLKDGIKNGDIKANININEVVGVTTALIQGAILHAKVSGKINYLNASMNYLETMIKQLER